MILTSLSSEARLPGPSQPGSRPASVLSYRSHSNHRPRARLSTGAASAACPSDRRSEILRLRGPD
eukprot:581096-Hanusia_phi.AAC.1